MAIQGSVISSSSIWLNQISPPPGKPFTVLITVYDTVFLCWIRLLSWTCCLIWTPPFPGRRKGYWSWCDYSCLWTVSWQGKVGALSVQSMDGTCTWVPAQGFGHACTPSFHCYFLDCRFEEVFLFLLPCCCLLCPSKSIPVAEQRATSGT